MTKTYAKLVKCSLALLMVIGIQIVTTSDVYANNPHRAAILMVDGQEVQMRLIEFGTAYTLAGTRVAGFLSTAENFDRWFGEYEFFSNGNQITAEQAFVVITDIIFYRADGIVVMNTPAHRIPLTTVTMPQVSDTEESIVFDFRALEAAGFAYEGIQTMFELEVIRLVNEIRASYGLPALTLHPELARIARLRTEEKVKYDVRGHLSPTTGLEHTAHARAMGLDVAIAGENSIRGSRTPQETIDVWMDSPGHRDFILSGHSTSRFRERRYIGVGFSFGDRTTAWTLWQTCGNPAPR